MGIVQYNEGIRKLLYNISTIVLAGLISTGLAVALLLRTDLRTYDHPDFFKPADHHKYIYMATHSLGDFRIAPFCWRIGLPLLIQVLPFKVQSGFLLVTLLSIGGTGLVLWSLIKSMGYSDLESLFAILLYFSIPWGPKYQLYDFWLPDALSLLIVSLVFYFTVRQKPWLVGVILGLGVLVKEAVIFATPLVYTLQARRIVDVSQLRKTLPVVLLPILLLIIVRAVIPARNHDPNYLASLPPELSQVQRGTAEYSLIYLLNNIAKERIEQASLRELYRWTIGSFGLLPVFLGLLGVFKNPNLALRLSPFILLSSCQPLFAVNVQRLVVLASPAVVLLAIVGAEKMIEHLPRFSHLLLPLGFLSLLPNLIIYRRFLPGIEVYVFAFQTLIVGVAVLVCLILQRSPRNQ